jgi:hypothetical protein
MPYTGTELTVKLILKLAVIPLLPLTVTVAVYVPTARPVLGATVKVPVPPAEMLPIAVLESVKDPLSVPERAADKAPAA